MSLGHTQYPLISTLAHSASLIRPFVHSVLVGAQWGMSQTQAISAKAADMTKAQSVSHACRNVK